MRQAVTPSSVRSSARHRGEAAAHPLSRLGRAVAAALLAGVILGGILLLLSAALLLGGGDPGSFTAPVGAVILLVSSFFSGFAGGTLYRGGRLFPFALIVASLWALLVYLLSLVTIGESGGFSSSVYALSLRLVSAGLAVFGTHVAMRKRSKARSARRAPGRRR